MVNAWADDPDTDKTTNGNLTWYMVSLDQYSQYFAFSNPLIQLLSVNRTIDWSVGTERTIVIGVKDNVSYMNYMNYIFIFSFIQPTTGTQMSATASITVCWECPAFTGSSTSSSTTVPTTTVVTESVAFLVPVVILIFKKNTS